MPCATMTFLEQTLTHVTAATFLEFCQNPRNQEAFQIRQGRENGLLGIAPADSPSNSALETDLVGLRHTSIFGNLDPSVRRLQM